MLLDLLYSEDIDIKDLEKYFLASSQGQAPRFSPKNFITMARDAIGLKGISMENAGEKLPEPSDLLSIHPEEGMFADDGKGIVTLVDVDFLVYRRKNGNRMV